MPETQGRRAPSLVGPSVVFGLGMMGIVAGITFWSASVGGMDELWRIPWAIWLGSLGALLTLIGFMALAFNMGRRDGHAMAAAAPDLGEPRAGDDRAP